MEKTNFYISLAYRLSDCNFIKNELGVISSLYYYNFFDDELDIIIYLISILKNNNININQDFCSSIYRIICRYRKESNDYVDIYNNNKFNTFRTAAWFMANIYNDIENISNDRKKAMIAITLAYKIIEKPFIYSGNDEIVWFDKVDVVNILKEYNNQVLEDATIKFSTSLMNNNTNYSLYADKLQILYHYALKYNSIDEALARGEAYERRKKIVMTRNQKK